MRSTEVTALVTRGICTLDTLIKGQDIANIVSGKTLCADGLPGNVRWAIAATVCE